MKKVDASILITNYLEYVKRWARKVSLDTDNTNVVAVTYFTDKSMHFNRIFHLLSKDLTDGKQKLRLISCLTTFESFYLHHIATADEYGCDSPQYLEQEKIMDKLFDEYVCLLSDDTKSCSVQEFLDRV